MWRSTCFGSTAGCAHTWGGDENRLAPRVLSGLAGANGNMGCWRRRLQYPSNYQADPYFPDAVFVFGDSEERTRTALYGPLYNENILQMRDGRRDGIKFEEFGDDVIMFTIAELPQGLKNRQAAIAKASIRRERAEKVTAEKNSAIGALVFGSLLPPSIVLALGLVLAWVIAGFRTRAQ